MKEIKYISIVRFEQTQWRKEENKEIFPEIFYNYGTLKISVTVHPNSRKPRIEKDLFGALHVYVSAPPLLYGTRLLDVFKIEEGKEQRFFFF